MRGHLALTSGTHAEAFFGLREDHRGSAVMVMRGVISGKDLAQIMAATSQPVDLFIGQGGANRLQHRVLSEKVLAVEGPIMSGKGLELAIDGTVECIDQLASDIARE